MFIKYTPLLHTLTVLNTHPYSLTQVKLLVYVENALQIGQCIKLE